jgi:Midasin AAA lid domain
MPSPSAIGGPVLLSHACATGVLHPAVPEQVLARMVACLGALHAAAAAGTGFGAAGGPWEFNLRDLLRWCELAEGASGVWESTEGASGAPRRSGGGRDPSGTAKVCLRIHPGLRPFFAAFECRLLFFAVF